MSKTKLAVPLAPALLSLALSVGAATVFSACARREDGTWMNCHQCQNTVVAGGIGLVALFGASAAIKNKPTRIALQALAVIASLFVFFIPGGICPMCMMKTMRCYTVFQPFTRVMTVLIAATGIGALVDSLKMKKTGAPQTGAAQVDTIEAGTASTDTNARDTKKEILA
ncbi:DUF4418 family protein [Schaalia cardiffensis]|uniref:DUF4418 family protein n=1 Tax=Schaalia cardiffensis TaxID=181487 RepID=UPI0023F0B6DF|nr:DUF4418 family protein [Schaalia cardiffensis]